MRQEQHRAVRRCYLECLRRDLAAGAGLVLHDDVGAKLVLELLRQHAGDGIGTAAGREADQQLNGGGLRGRQGPEQQTGCSQAQGAALESKNHGVTPVGKNGNIAPQCTTGA